MTNTTLDAAIEAACKEVNIGRPNGFQEFDRAYARALVAKLLEGMEAGDRGDFGYGYDTALTEIRRRAGLEDLS
jgi:hypothetical protein